MYETSGPKSRKHAAVLKKFRSMRYEGIYTPPDLKGILIRIMQKGDVVKCLPGIEHWHVASPGTNVSHIAIVPNAGKEMRCGCKK